ncbi:hypothetical protein [Bradyrhizobium sp. SZCCHNR3003]|uniref:hypothetical protein n=2 Tax=Nitrobacteraceae TaxID=41294 RepID=UPI00291611CA|nr:hypothetical protein [Bradyrhizobium sp. SZCCHNR3003]
MNQREASSRRRPSSFSHRVVLAAKDRTADCKGALLNTRYSDGRAGFYFVMLAGGMMTVSSPGDVEQRQPANARAYPVDMIIFKVDGDIRKLTAKGMCRAKNMAGALSGLTCRAGSEAGRFEDGFSAETKAVETTPTESKAAGTKAAGSKMPGL